MSKSGISVTKECIDKFNDLKLGKEMKYIIYKLNDEYTDVVVEETSNDRDWETFRKALINAKSKDKRGNEGVGPRYAVYDFEYELPGGEGTRNKITFIAWSPDNAGVQPKMVYASSKVALKMALSGVGAEVQANEENDIEYDEIKKQVIKNAR